MKVSELIKLLDAYQDFNVSALIFRSDSSTWGAGLEQYEHISIGDIGHSDKVIALNFSHDGEVRRELTARELIVELEAICKASIKGKIREFDCYSGCRLGDCSTDTQYGDICYISGILHQKELLLSVIEIAEKQKAASV